METLWVPEEACSAADRKPLALMDLYTEYFNRHGRADERRHTVADVHGLMCAAYYAGLMQGKRVERARRKSNDF